MCKLFIIDWITTYLNTPELQRTPADELLFYTALLIIAGAIWGVIWCVTFGYTKFKR